MKVLLFAAAIALSGSFVLTAAPRDAAKLAPEERKQLERDKVLVMHRSYPQVFTPYIFSPMPVFITSDSVLNAFHVVLEETMAQMEERFSVRLGSSLDDTVARIKDPPADLPAERFAAAAKHARIVLGTAARLAGGTWKGEPDVEGLIAAEVQRVMAAADVAMPPWLAKTDDVAGVDYRVFKPSGFYTRNERMKAYFRAVRWMQNIPFRAAVPVEMDAMTLLVPALAATSLVPDIAKVHHALAGGATDADVEALRDDYKANDFPGADWLGERNPSRMVLLAAADVPDGRLFQQTTNAARPFPDPLEIAALLQRPPGLELVGKTVPGALTEVFSKAREQLAENRSLYADYLRCLGLLLDAPDAGAPAFLKSQAWQRKSLNTVEAGWAQLRHTWALQAKDDAMWLSAGMPFPGFVEPDPDFFAALSRLMIRCMEQFDAMEVFAAPIELLEFEARELIPLFEKEIAARKVRPAQFDAITREGRAPTEAEIKAYGEAAKLPDGLLTQLHPFAGILPGLGVAYPGKTVTSVSNPENVLGELKEIATGKKRDALRADYRKETSLRDRWMKLLGVCHQLESLAHKHLRGIEPTEREAQFIVYYGEALGGIMFYDGNSYHSPHDDAPRAACVFNRPGGQCLIAAVGRPREIRVLYPWKGKEIECRGAVMPFHSFLSDTRVTDKEWIAMLDAEKPPALESWLQPIVTPVKPEKK